MLGVTLNDGPMQTEGSSMDIEQVETNEPSTQAYLDNVDYHRESYYESSSQQSPVDDLDLYLDSDESFIDPTQLHTPTQSTYTQ